MKLISVPRPTQLLCCGTDGDGTSGDSEMNVLRVEHPHSVSHVNKYHFIVYRFMVRIELGQ